MWWWSWLLTAVGVFGLYLAGRKNRYGWAVGIGAQVLWFAYALSTHQWGFIVSCLAYGWVYSKNFLAWWRESKNSAESGGFSVDADLEPGDMPQHRATTDDIMAGTRIRRFGLGTRR